MKGYDEYQKLMRYKYGNYSFNVLLFLMLINGFISTHFNFQWAESKENEYLLLILPALYYYFVMCIYKGAYYKKNQLSTYHSFFLGLIGLIYTIWSFTSHSYYIDNGQVTTAIVFPFIGFMWISGSIAYLIKSLVEKRRDKKESDE